jgi:hypothetical protein
MKWTPWGVTTLVIVSVVVMLFVYAMVVPSSDPRAVGRLAKYPFWGWIVAAVIRKFRSGKNPWSFV